MHVNHFGTGALWPAKERESDLCPLLQQKGFKGLLVSSWIISYQGYLLSWFWDLLSWVWEGASSYKDLFISRPYQADHLWGRDSVLAIKRSIWRSFGHQQPQFLLWNVSGNKEYQGLAFHYLLLSTWVFWGT